MSEPSRKTQVPGAPAAAIPPKVLVVDADGAVASSLAKVLSDNGFEPTVVSNGEQALEAIRSGSFLLVVVEGFLPDTTGVTLFRAARRIQPDLKGIVLSGSGDLDSYLDALADGVHTFLPRSLAVQQLIREVRTILRT